MKKQPAGLMLVCGTVLGVALTLCIGAVSKGAATKDAPPEDASKKVPAHLQIVSYPNGGTGFFDPETATVYVYDSELRNCYMTRQITALGDPLVHP